MEDFLLKRPKPSDTEEELFEMQEEFLKSRQQPSAKVVNLRKQRGVSEQSSNIDAHGQTGMKFRSKFAERRAMTSQAKLCTPTPHGDELNPQVAQEILQSEQDTHQLEDPVQNIPLESSKILLGNIVEKKFDNDGIQALLSTSTSSETGFPKVFRLDHSEKSDSQCGSLFYQTLKTQAEAADCTESNKSVDRVPMEPTAAVGDSLLSEIHEKNMEIISTMTEAEILRTKAELETNLDPKLIQFLKSRGSQTKQKATTETIQMDIDNPSASSPKNTPSEDSSGVSPVAEVDPPGSVAEIIKESTSKGWVHMDEVEEVKLEWMKDIPEVKPENPPPAEPYNARFDFNGLLLPFKDPTLSVDRGLHHHGEEPERPGYSLQELLQLSRSATQQQRCTALTTLGHIMEKSRQGWYDQVLDPAPLIALNDKNILFLLRFSLDDSSVAVITATLQALRSFLYSEADEVCLDRLCDWSYPDGSCIVPELSPPPMDIADTSDLKDHELAKLDCVAAAMRSNLVQRIRYILSEMKPPLAGVTAALEILIRLARRSETTALNIATTPQLLETIVQNFIPLTTDRLVTRDLQNGYGVPSVSAVRLCRVLIEYAGQPVANRLANLAIIQPLLSYASSNAGEAGLRLPIEALRLWRCLVTHGIARDSVEGSRRIIGAQLKLLLSNHDLANASELSCEHAAALVAISHFDTGLKSTICTLVTKWSTQLTAVPMPTWTSTKLIAVGLETLQDISPLNTAFVANVKLFDNLSSSSNLLSGCTPISGRDPPSLPSLSALCHGGEVQPAVAVTSFIPFFATLCNAFVKASRFDELATIIRNADVIKYFRKLVNSDWTMQSSWYTRAELFLLTGVVRASVKLSNNSLVEELILKIAIKLIPTLPADASEAVKEILGIVLANNRLTVEKLADELSSLKIEGGKSTIALNLPSNLAIAYAECVRVSRQWDQPAMPVDWLFWPLVAAYDRQKNKEKWQDSDTTRVIVVLSLKLAMPELFHNLSPTLRFSRMVLVYLCDTVCFNEDVSLLLTSAMSLLIKKKHRQFNFNDDLPGLNSFTDLFTAMCENFCANSYGDDGFAMTLLVPIAQRHDVHYRKLLWSEHAAAIRYLRLSIEKLSIPLADYLYPVEEDTSLIECYMTALVRNTVRKEWSPIMHAIAMHHSAMFLRGTSKLAERMRARLQSIKDQDLSDSLLNYTPPDM